MTSFPGDDGRTPRDGKNSHSIGHFGDIM